jgi:hypothetical protein
MCILIILVGSGIKFVGEGGVLVKAVIGACPAGETWAMATVVTAPEMYGNEA